MSVQLGIDLGTTNSVVACFRRGKVEVIPIDGNNTLPSVMAIRSGEEIVGRAAKARLLMDPNNTIASTKRDMGSDITYNFGNRVYTPEDIAFNILKTIKLKAGEYLNEEIRDAVITVPAYFTSEQRESTKKAAIRAGFNVLRLIPEPTAAAIDYGLDQNKDQILMVYDLGGGTFDISIMKVKGNDFEVLGVEGDNHLGGDDFDDIISKLLIKQVNEDMGINLALSKEKEHVAAIIKIKECAEKAKIELTDMEITEIFIPNLINDYCLERTISRKEFNSAVQMLVNRTISKMDSVLRKVRLKARDIDKVILVGGSTKMPIIKETIRERIKEPYIAENVDEVVARGAAIMALSLYTPEDKNIANEKSKVNLSKDFNVTEKTVFTYGIDMINSFSNELMFMPIVSRGSKLPAVGGVIGATSKPNQDSVIMNVFRGENDNPNNNQYLGRLSMKIETRSENPLPILALFEIDENMIIKFISAQVPLEEPYIGFLEENDIQMLRYCVERKEFNSKEVKIDAKGSKR